MPNTHGATILDIVHELPRFEVTGKRRQAWQMEPADDCDPNFHGRQWRLKTPPIVRPIHVINRAARRAATRGKKRLPDGMAPEEALREAIRQHSAGELREAEVVYHKVLSVMPRNADALHFLGVLRHQQGRTEEGVSLVQRALALAPAYVDAWSNLGNLYKESAHLDEAEAAYRRALALDERHAAAWNNLGIVLRARGQTAEAVAALRRAVDISATFADAHFNLGNALRECRRLQKQLRLTGKCFC